MVGYQTLRWIPSFQELGQNRQEVYQQRLPMFCPHAMVTIHKHLFLNWNDYTMEKIPATVAEITPQWLTQALRSTGVIKSATVTSDDRADVAFQGSTGPVI